MTDAGSSPLKKRSSQAAGGGREAPQPPAGASRVLQALVEELAKVPGIGKKTAERLAYHILRQPKSEALRLAHAIRDVKENVRHCKICFHITEAEECAICLDPERDPAVICVVEQSKDVYAIEATSSYHGRYHVLLGALAPLDGVEPAHLTIEALLERIRAGGVREVILATNPNFEGDGTALLLKERLRSHPEVRVTRIARGIPSGSHIEHVSRTIVQDALEGRREMSE